MKTVGIIDYKLNNLSSIYFMIKSLNYDPIFLSKANEEVDILVIPGVGSFNHGMKALKQKGFDRMILNHIDSGKILIAICLGFQFLFKESYEFELTKGLGILSGSIVPFNDELNKINIGWSKISLNKNNNFSSKKLMDIANNKYFYHVHSYYPDLISEKNILSYSYNEDYKFPSAICFNNIYGFQFHPEKSGVNGKNSLKYILEKKNEKF